jgi:hypothetical protein
MTKKTQTPATTRPEKNLPDKKQGVFCSTSALLAALTLLSASLRVANVALAEQSGDQTNAGSDTARAKLAENNAKKGSGDLCSTVKFKFTTTTKDKVDTYNTYKQPHPPQPAPINKPTLVAPTPPAITIKQK